MIKVFYIFIVLSLFVACQTDFKAQEKAPSISTEKKTSKNKAKPIPTNKPSNSDTNSNPQSNTTTSSKSGASSGTSSGANKKIDPSNVDLSLLENLIHDEINRARAGSGLPKLGKDPILRNAAVDQNNYQLTLQDLSHTQKTPGKRKLIDRVKFYGGGFQLLAENLIYEGFTVRTTNGVHKQIITPTYQRMAKDIVVAWMKSPTHRKNILTRELKLVGTAAAYNAINHAIYSTQVFGTR